MTTIISYSATFFLAYNEKEAREALPYLEQYKFYRSNPEK